MLTPWKESYDQPRHHIKKQRHYFANKGLSGQGYGFSSGHLWMWELDCEESWTPKILMLLNCGVGEDSWESLGLQEIQPVHPKGDQSWVSIGRTDAEAETPVLWPPHEKSWLIWEDPDAGRDWGEEEKGMTENEMAGWHHRLDRHEFKLWSWWWTGRPGVLQYMGSQRVGHNWVTELNWTESFALYLEFT